MASITQSDINAEASLVTAGSGASAESGTAAASELVSSVNAGALTAPSRAEAGLVTTGSGFPAGLAEAAVSATVTELAAVVEPFASAGPAASAVPEAWLIKRTGAGSAEGDSGTSASGSESGFGLLRSRVRIPQVHFWT